MNKVSKISSCVLSLILILNLGACSGSSPSGRKANQKKVPYRTSNTDPNRTSSRRTQTSSTSSQQTKPLNELYNKYKSSVFLIYTSDGSKGYQGTGFFISRNGLAISNYHVFEGTTKGFEVIQTIDEKQFEISEVLDQSKEHDYIIFRVKIGDYHIANPIPIVSHTSQIGDDVFAIGNPEGLANTLSKGIISGYRDSNNRIQTTAEITHGSSGGPLMNMDGEVIGITTSGYGEANLNFAINIKTLNLSRFK
ncbi:MAG: trypsin-like peptidase domain-containing protein [Gammaproteobacteria bacterium]|nr:trypsin-like peptidase domain-containing protein [Gammaproteobacteria bacterium]